MKEKVLEKSTKWVMPILCSLLAILIGINLHRAIIEESWLAVGLAIVCCLLMVGATFISSRTNFLLGQIKATEESIERMKKIEEMLEEEKGNGGVITESGD